MKSLLFLISILVITISSCKKPDYGYVDPYNIDWPGPPNPFPNFIPTPSFGGISASVNGTVTSFSAVSKAQLSGSYHIHIGGVTGTSSLELDIQSPSPITAGVFTENAIAGSSIATIHYSWYDPSGWRVAVPFNSTTNPVTIAITAIDSTSVQGTFKGDLKYTPSSGSSTIKVIKDGVFDVRFQ